MPPTTKITSKGRITLPLQIRQRLGLKNGDRVEVVIDNGRTIIRPAKPSENPFEKYVGVLPAFATRQEIQRWVATLRNDNQDRRSPNHSPGNV